MSAFAGAGAAAWVVPEILTAKPAAGATMSGTHGGGGGGTTNPVTNPSQAGGTGSGTGSTPATLTSATGGSGTPAALASTGLNIQRDAEIGAALIAGGWAMHHWASRAPKPAAEGAGGAHEAGSADTPS